MIFACRLDLYQKDNEPIDCRHFKDKFKWVELPCRVGDTVYRIHMGNYESDHKPFIKAMKVTEISKKISYCKDLPWAIIADGIRYKFTSIGKSVFLSMEEAKSAMQEFIVYQQRDIANLKSTITTLEKENQELQNLVDEYGLGKECKNEYYEDDW